MITTHTSTRVVTAAVLAGAAWLGARRVGALVEGWAADDNELLFGTGLVKRADPYGDLARRLLPRELSDRAVLLRAVLRGNPILYKIKLTPDEVTGLEPDAVIMNNFFDGQGRQGWTVSCG